MQKEELAPNVLAMVHAFNSLAQLVPTEVLVEEKVQQRAKVVSAYIKVEIVTGGESCMSCVVMLLGKVFLSFGS